jgi:RNA polymerase sigma-70 factor (ECF subfamily)
MTQPATQATPAESDLALARRCAAGDQAAVRALTGANNQRLFRAAWSILKDRSEAEDAVQATYLNAFASLDKFEGRSSLSTWLTRIVINEALGRLRAAARRQADLEQRGVIMLDEHRAEPSPDAALAREQLRILLERAVSDLPSPYRTVFVLRDVEGLSVEETSDALAILPATVKTRLFRARRLLRQALTPEVQNALSGTFPFAGADCERLTAKLLNAIPLAARGLPS